MNPYSSYNRTDRQLYQICQDYGFNNDDSCEAGNFLANLFEMNDFSLKNIKNPFSFVFLFWPNYNTTNLPGSDAITTNPGYLSFNMFFFAICYAYSVFRLVIDVAVIFYARQKIKMMLDDKEVAVKIKEDPDLGKEISYYKWIVYAAVCFEFTMSVHNYIVWRGLQYYTSAQDNYYPIYSKPPRICNCIYNPALYNWDNSYIDFYPYKLKGLQAAYGLWVIFEILGMFIIYFSVLTLSRINRKGKKGKQFLMGICNKSIFLSLFYGFFLLLLIFYFDMPVFYKFYNYQVLAFWFFWKVIGFLLLLDRLYSKYWLFKTLQIHSLHNHAHHWIARLKSAEEDDLKNNVIEAQEDETLKTQKFLSKDDKEKINEILIDHHKNINKVLEKKIKDSYKEIKTLIRRIITKIEKSKLKMNWQDYLNYFLGLNLIGAIGYFFLLIDVVYVHVHMDTIFYPEKTVSGFYFIGIFFCYSEIVIFDLTHGIFLLHCFFVEWVDYLNRCRGFFENKILKKLNEIEED